MKHFLTEKKNRTKTLLIVRSVRAKNYENRDKTRKLVNKHAPLKPLLKRKFKQSSKPWITKGILKSIKIKNVLFTSGHVDKYRFYRNKITTLIRHNKKLYYQTYFSQHMKDLKKTWSGINEVMSRKKRKSKPIIGLK